MRSKKVLCDLCDLKVYNMLKAVKVIDRGNKEYYYHRECFEKLNE